MKRSSVSMKDASRHCPSVVYNTYRHNNKLAQLLEEFQCQYPHLGREALENALNQESAHNQTVSRDLLRGTNSGQLIYADDNDAHHITLDGLLQPERLYRPDLAPVDVCRLQPTQGAAMVHTHTEALVDSQLDGGETKHIEMIMTSSPRKPHHNIRRLFSRAPAKADRKHILLQDDPTESQLQEIYPWCQSTAQAMVPFRSSGNGGKKCAGPTYIGPCAGGDRNRGSP